MSSEISVSFDFECKGVGRCLFSIGQGDTNSVGANHRVIWNVNANDSTKGSITLHNIKVNPPFNTIKYISFTASPVWTALGSYGVSNFIIDNLIVEEKDSLDFDYIKKWAIELGIDDALNNLLEEAGL